MYFFEYISRIKLYRNDLKGNINYFELAGGGGGVRSSYRGFEIPRVNYSKRMKEIQGKSTLVVELARGSS